MNFRRTVFVYCISAAMLLACARRPTTPSALSSQKSEEPTIQSTYSDEHVADMEKTYQEQSDASKKISDEKSTMEASISSLNEQVQSMTRQMDETVGMTDPQKADLQTQIDGLEQEKAAMEAKAA